MHMDKATEFQKTRSIYLNAVLRGDLQDLRVRVASRFKRRTVFRSFLRSKTCCVISDHALRWTTKKGPEGPFLCVAYRR